MAYIVVSNVTDSTISVYLDGLDSSYSLYDRIAHWYIGLTPATVYNDGNVILPAFVTSGGNNQFNGLLSSTSYYIDCQVETNTGIVNIPGIYVTTSAPGPSPGQRPSYFYWTYAKQSGQPFNLTASEWNGLTANVNAVRNYKGYLSYPFTTAYTGNTFTAAMYNQVVNAIQGILGYGTNLSIVNSGETIYAYQMNDLVSAINLVP